MYDDRTHQSVRIGDVVIIPSINVRELDEGIVKEFAESMLAYGEGDASREWDGSLNVTTDGFLYNGFHTHAAAVLAFGEDFKFKARVEGTGEEDAFLRAATFNGTHGVRFNNAEKRIAVTRWLEAHPDMTDRAIAKVTNTSHPFVKSVSDALETDSSLERPTRRRYQNDDGDEVWIETANIGEAEVLEAQMPPEPPEPSIDNDPVLRHNEKERICGLIEAEEELMKERFEKLKGLTDAVEAYKEFHESASRTTHFETFLYVYREMARSVDVPRLPHWNSWDTITDLKEKLALSRAMRKSMDAKGGPSWRNSFVTQVDNDISGMEAEQWIRGHAEDIFIEEGVCSVEKNLIVDNDPDPDYHELYFWSYGNRLTLFAQAGEAAGIPRDDIIAQRRALENRDEWVVAFFGEMRDEFNRLRLRRAIKEIADVARWGKFKMKSGKEALRHTDNVQIMRVNQLLSIGKNLMEGIDEPGMLVNDEKADEEVAD